MKKIPFEYTEESGNDVFIRSELYGSSIKFYIKFTTKNSCLNNLSNAVYANLQDAIEDCDKLKTFNFMTKDVFNA